MRDARGAEVLRVHELTGSHWNAFERLTASSLFARTRADVAYTKAGLTAPAGSPQESVNFLERAILSIPCLSSREKSGKIKNFTGSQVGAAGSLDLAFAWLLQRAAKGRSHALDRRFKGRARGARD